jgi:Terminase large subunit, T4likevirus-type, N-terminal
VARISAALGSPLLPWQRLVADVGLEHDERGVPYYREVRLTVPRQQGKTTLILAIATDRCLAFDRPQRVLYTAQDRNHAREKWIEQVEMLERSPLRRLFRVRRSNGSERITWRTGSVLGITASGDKSGHGFTLDEAFIDEAFAQVDDRLVQGFRPAMVTRRDAQLWILSTAGTEESVFLRDRVDDGRARVEADERAGVAYFEWSAPDDWVVSDRETWRAAMPALGLTIDEETVAADFATMDQGEFARAYLNRWAPKGVPVFAFGQWLACLDAASAAQGSLAFAIDVAPDRSTASIAAAGGRADGRVHVELVDRRDGTDWVVSRMGELVDRWRPVAVVVDPGAPAGSLVTGLSLARVPLLLCNGRQYGQACGAFYDDVIAGRLAHRGQPALDDAVAGGRKRPLGDAWAWARIPEAADPAPLIAATLARWGWSTAPPVGPQIFV